VIYNHDITEQSGAKMSSLKFKVMAFKGQFPCTSKIVIHSTVLEQIYTFTYLGRKIY